MLKEMLAKGQITEATLNRMLYDTLIATFGWASSTIRPQAIRRIVLLRRNTWRCREQSSRRALCC